jgi:hypothetical protein
VSLLDWFGRLCETKDERAERERKEEDRKIANTVYWRNVQETARMQCESADLYWKEHQKWLDAQFAQIRYWERRNAYYRGDLRFQGLGEDSDGQDIASEGRRP